MRRELHSWRVTPQEAIRIQLRLAAQVSRSNAIPSEPRYIAGMDISGEDKDGFAIGAVVVLSYPEMEVVEVKRSRVRPGFPYVPGLLSFRESPVLLAAIERLTLEPDLFLVDGQGLAHPRRFGIACHLGLLLDIPTIGCAKSILKGRYHDLGIEAGSHSDLVDQMEVVGAAVRTRSGVSPIYVSIGHKVNMESSIRWTLACCKGYRIPEPTRLAHQAAGLRLDERDPTTSRSESESSE
jgi:deoxyribonuclease V